MIAPELMWLLAAAVGLCVGSFLNVVIHRVPRMLEQQWQAQCAELAGAAPAEVPAYNLVVPRSACPSCARPIRAVENVPVFSWLLLRGRCAGCGTAISPRYPTVELMGALAALAVIAFFGFNVKAGAAVMFLWTLLALTFIDFDTQLLPDSMTQPLLWAGLLVNLWGVFVPIESAVIGAVAGYLSLWLIYWGFKLLTGKEGMGYGDFKLLAALGAWLGWKMLLPIVLLSSAVGALVGIALIAMRGRDRAVPLAFGPYLAVAGAIALFWGNTLVKLYLP
ncbi:MAG: A24 family peptidase [Pseudomonadota bacterium]|nr:A24 family peptidase [Pseudomonadota bacterium]